MSGIQGLSTIDRFMQHVIPEPNSGCWLWIGAEKHNGYGVFNKGNDCAVRAHRWSYEHFKGPIQPGLVVCHSCDVRCCVNPNHLWVGTIKDNQQDMSKKGRFKSRYKDQTHCKWGHPFSGPNLKIISIKGKPSRQCVTCVKNRTKTYYSKSKEAA